jgi:hypothetical protein
MDLQLNVMVFKRMTLSFPADDIFVCYVGMRSRFPRLGSVASAAYDIGIRSFTITIETHDDRELTNKQSYNRVSRG